MGFDQRQMQEWERQGGIEGVQLVVWALVMRGGRLFAHLRAYDRKLFPGCWDLAGGHVEPGETIYEALVRELLEETGWELDDVVALAKGFDWANGDAIMREYDFLVTVKGDAEAVLEEGKVIEGRWIGVEETGVLTDHRENGDSVMKEVFEAGFAKMRELGLLA